MCSGLFAHRTRPQQIAARDRTLPVFAEALAQRTYEELAGKFEAAGIPFSRIARPAEMYDDPHVNRPGGLYESLMAEGGSFRAPGLPFEVDGAASRAVSLDLPNIGDDTCAILGELGFDEASIARARGASEAA